MSDRKAGYTFSIASVTPAPSPAPPVPALAVPAEELADIEDLLAESLAVEAFVREHLDDLQQRPTFFTRA